jgi:rRNA maturation protein Nop10
VDAPAAAQRWPRYWFNCPHCGLRQFAAHALVKPMGLRYGDSLVLFSFWCSNCGGYSALRHPARFGLGLIVVPLILFVLIYTYFARLGWLAVVPALMFGVIWSYAGVLLVTRLVNRYVRLEGAPE